MDEQFERWVEEARAVKIEHVAEALGIRMPARGEYQGPCPACNGTDRFSINTKKQVFNCRGSGGGDALAMVQHVNGCDFVAACEYVNNSPPPSRDSTYRDRDPEVERERREERKDAEIERQRQEEADTAKKLNNAAALFERGELMGVKYKISPIAATQAEDYLESRGIPLNVFEPSDLRFVYDLLYKGFADEEATEETDLGHFHCMIAAVRDARGRIQGVHRTYLNPGGSKKLICPGDRSRNKAKKGTFKMMGGLIMLKPPVHGLLAVAEGVETALSWLTMADFGAWGDAYIGAGVAAAYSLGNLTGAATGSIPHPKPPRGRQNATIPNGEPDMQSLAMSIPEGVNRLLLLGDGDVDSDGEFKRETVAKLATGKARFQKLGFEVSSCIADRGMDFNDMLLARTKREAA